MRRNANYLLSILMLILTQAAVIQQWQTLFSPSESRGNVVDILPVSGGQVMIAWAEGDIIGFNLKTKSPISYHSKNNPDKTIYSIRSMAYSGEVGYVYIGDGMGSVFKLNMNGFGENPWLTTKQNGEEWFFNVILPFSNQGNFNLFLGSAMGYIVQWNPFSDSEITSYLANPPSMITTMIITDYVGEKHLIAGFSSGVVMSIHSPLDSTIIQSETGNRVASLKIFRNVNQNWLIVGTSFPESSILVYDMKDGQLIYQHILNTELNSLLVAHDQNFEEQIVYSTTLGGVYQIALNGLSTSSPIIELASEGFFGNAAITHMIFNWITLKDSEDITPVLLIGTQDGRIAGYLWENSHWEMLGNPSFWELKTQEISHLYIIQVDATINSNQLCAALSEGEIVILDSPFWNFVEPNPLLSQEIYQFILEIDKPHPKIHNSLDSSIQSTGLGTFSFLEMKTRLYDQQYMTLILESEDSSQLDLEFDVYGFEMPTQPLREDNCVILCSFTDPDTGETSRITIQYDELSSYHRLGNLYHWTKTYYYE